MRFYEIEFFNRLNNLCSFLDISYNVNHGGCCFIAFIISKFLDSYNIKYELYIEEDNCAKDLNAINFEVKNNKQNYTNNTSITGAFTCKHYFLNINGYGLINDDCADLDNCYCIRNINHSNIKWIYDNGYWNDKYDICNNDKIIKFIKLLFEEYEKEIN